MRLISNDFSSRVRWEPEFKIIIGVGMLLAVGLLIYLIEEFFKIKDLKKNQLIE
jgi:hypothetical protein